MLVGRERFRPGALACRAASIRGVPLSRSQVWRRMIDRAGEERALNLAGSVIWHRNIAERVCNPGRRRQVVHRTSVRHVDLDAHCTHCGEGLRPEETARVWRAVIHPIDPPAAALCTTCHHHALNVQEGTHGAKSAFLKRSHVAPYIQAVTALHNGKAVELPEEKTAMTNTRELREALLQDFKALRNGEISRSEARARASVARQVIETIKVEAVADAMNVDRYNPVVLSSAVTAPAAIAAE